MYNKNMTKLVYNEDSFVFKIEVNFLNVLKKKNFLKQNLFFFYKHVKIN